MPCIALHPESIFWDFLSHTTHGTYEHPTPYNTSIEPYILRGSARATSTGLLPRIRRHDATFDAEADDQPAEAAEASPGTTVAVTAHANDQFSQLAVPNTNPSYHVAFIITTAQTQVRLVSSVPPPTSPASERKISTTPPSTPPTSFNIPNSHGFGFSWPGSVSSLDVGPSTLNETFYTCYHQRVLFMCRWWDDREKRVRVEFVRDGVHRLGSRETGWWVEMLRGSRLNRERRRWVEGWMDRDSGHERAESGEVESGGGWLWPEAWRFKGAWGQTLWLI